jgi:hypothetical protein
MGSPLAKPVGTDNRSKGTDNRTKGTDNGSKGTDNRSKGTDNRSKGTDNRRYGLRFRYEIVNDTSCDAQAYPPGSALPPFWYSRVLTRYSQGTRSGTLAVLTGVLTGVLQQGSTCLLGAANFGRPAGL